MPLLRGVRSTLHVPVPVEGGLISCCVFVSTIRVGAASTSVLVSTSAAVVKKKKCSHRSNLREKGFALGQGSRYIVHRGRKSRRQGHSISLFGKQKGECVLDSTQIALSAL